MGTLQSPTLGKLISSVRRMLNQPNASNSFWSDEELMDYLNEGIRVYFAEVVQGNEGQFSTTVDLNLVSGTETVALPSDFFEIRTLHRKTGSSYQIMTYNPDVTASYDTATSSVGDSYVPAYYFQENNIVLRPIPGASETAGLRLDYIKFPSTMVTGGDQMTANVSPVFKQVIEMYAVYKAKLRESLVNGTDTVSMAKSNLNELYKQFQECIVNRSKYPQYTIPFNP